MKHEKERPARGPASGGKRDQELERSDASAHAVARLAEGLVSAVALFLRVRTGRARVDETERVVVAVGLVAGEAARAIGRGALRRGGLVDLQVPGRRRVRERADVDQAGRVAEERGAGVAALADVVRIDLVAAVEVTVADAAEVVETVACLRAVVRRERGRCLAVYDGLAAVVAWRLPEPNTYALPLRIVTSVAALNAAALVTVGLMAPALYPGVPLMP